MKFNRLGSRSQRMVWTTASSPLQSSISTKTPELFRNIPRVGYSPGIRRRRGATSSPTDLLTHSKPCESIPLLKVLVSLGGFNEAVLASGKAA
jgi:hypothetical protein